MCGKALDLSTDFAGLSTGLGAVVHKLEGAGLRGDAVYGFFHRIQHGVKGFEA